MHNVVSHNGGILQVLPRLLGRRPQPPGREYTLPYHLDLCDCIDEAADSDLTPSGWLDVGRAGHKCQSNIGSLFHTLSMAQSSIFNAVLCSTQE